MEEATPIKPPRGRGARNKQDTSGLLMSLLEAMSKSDSDEHRSMEMLKLETEFNQSDKRLDILVNRHGDQLTQVMQVFGKVASQITHSRERMKVVKGSLEECKLLLRCRREELRKQWLEGVEYKHALQLLEDISALREVPAQVSQNLARKQYTAATQCLISALALSDGQLRGIEALRDLRAKLQAKKTTLHSKLLEELREHIYVIPTTDALNFRRQGSGKEAGLSPFQRGFAYLRGSKGSKARRKLLDVPGREQAELDLNVEDETEDLSPEERAELWFTTISECLCLLNNTYKAVESVKSSMQSELRNIVSRCSRTILDSNQTVIRTKTEATIEGRKLLLELLETSLDHFRRVAAAHALFLRCISKTCQKHNVAVRLYDMNDVWNEIQAVLQLWLSHYLDSGDLGDARDSPAFNVPAVDISSYFTRRKPQRPKKAHLFRFDHAESSINLSKESTDTARAIQPLVCPVDIKNITVVYSSLSRLVDELEQRGTRPCPLHTYLQNYVQDVFLKIHRDKLSSRIDAAMKDRDAWKAVTNPGATKNMGLSRPLLQSTVTVEQSVVELRELMRTLPEFADKLLGILCELLRNYREVCQAAYRGIVQPESEDKRIFSSAWLKDEDINRFIKSLPNWAALQAQKPTHRNRKLRREETTDEESPEDIRQRNVKEAVILASNIGEGGIRPHELISDVSQLKKLAQLHESMEWFAAQVLLVSGDLKALRAEDHLKSSISEQNQQALFQLVHEFTDLADICLLVLHLEVRVQCFHYLLSKSSTLQKLDVLYQEPDPKVVELSRILIDVHEAMTTSLQPRKTKYIFEGLGHLIAKILISSAQYLERIDESGVERMCRNVFALQQTLSNMTATRDLALDHAKAFFGLFHLTPDEVLAGIVERGAQFVDMEYMNALQLLHRSHPQTYGPIENYLERLSDILGETGVTV